MYSFQKYLKPNVHRHFCGVYNLLPSWYQTITDFPWNFICFLTILIKIVKLMLLHIVVFVIPYKKTNSIKICFVLCIIEIRLFYYIVLMQFVPIYPAELSTFYYNWMEILTEILFYIERITISFILIFSS